MGEFLRQRSCILVLNLQKDFVDVLLAVAGEPIILQRKDINIADRLQIIGLQKVFYTFGQLGCVFAEATGKNDFQIQACRKRHFDGLPMLGGAGDAVKICLRMQKIMRFKKAFLV